MTILNVAVALFLLIFASTAAITLLALIGKVRMPEHYRKQLFRLLIVEVISIVTAFVADNVTTDRTPFLSDNLLLQGQGTWDWAYPEKGWRATLTFEKQKAGLNLKGTTYYVNDRRSDEKVPVVYWQSIAPITMPSLKKQLVFKAKMRWLQEAVQIEPRLAGVVGKEFEGQMELRIDVALRGSFTPDSTKETWGIMMTRIWQ